MLTFKQIPLDFEEIPSVQVPGLDFLATRGGSAQGGFDGGGVGRLLLGPDSVTRKPPETS